MKTLNICGLGGSEKLSDLPQVTQLVSDSDGPQALNFIKMTWV